MFGINLDSNIEYENVKVVQQNENLLFSIDDTFFLKDDISYITDYCSKLSGLLELNPQSILIGGLGLGIIPFYLETFTSITDIDVVENNINVMNVTMSLHHLKSTNIFFDNFRKFRTNKKYDLIIADLWWIKPNDFDDIQGEIVTHYWKSLNENGRIYFPIVNRMF